jgi:ABC-type transporter Mla subunit MlaD
VFDIKELHIHNPGMDELAKLIAGIETNLKEHIMATVQELVDAIAAEKDEVTNKLDALAVEIQALKDQIAQGGTITEAQLDSVLVGIQDIFTPAP